MASSNPVPLHEDRLHRRVLRACDAIGDFIEYWGFKASHGRVWCLLALTAEPLSQAEIARRLDVSRATVSGTIKELVGYGLVRPVSSGRQAPYEAVMDVWPTVSDVLRSREWQLVDHARGALEAALEEAELRRRAGGEVPYDIAHMRLLLAMTDMAQRFLRLLIALRKPGAAEELIGWVGAASRLVRQRLSDLWRRGA